MPTFLVLVLLLSGALFADPSISCAGAGTRSWGMANNFTALASDYSSLFWNPAGMAFVSHREAHIAMDWHRERVAGILSGDTATAMARRLRVSSGGLIRSLPTTRGGYAFALGFMSPWVLDDQSNFTGSDVYRGSVGRAGFQDTLWPGDTLYRNRLESSTRGSIDLWSMGMGWQVAPGLGFGFSCALVTGHESRENTVISSLRQREYEHTAIWLDREYVGFDARVGLMFRPHPAVSIGCRLGLPCYAKVGENYREINVLSPQESFDQTSIGALVMPFSGAWGVAFLFPFATVAADLSARAPLADAAEKTDGAYMKGGGGIGIEAPLSWVASLIRTGYSYRQVDLSPGRIVWDEQGADPQVPVSRFRGRHCATAGYSLLLQGGFSFDVAYGCEWWEFATASAAWESEAAEAHGRHRVMASLAIKY